MSRMSMITSTAITNTGRRPVSLSVGRMGANVTGHLRVCLPVLILNRDDPLFCGPVAS